MAATLSMAAARANQGDFVASRHMAASASASRSLSSTPVEGQTAVAQPQFDDADVRRPHRTSGESAGHTEPLAQIAR